MRERHVKFLCSSGASGRVRPSSTANLRRGPRWEKVRKCHDEASQFWNLVGTVLQRTQAESWHFRGNRSREASASGRWC
jgi:hypothetical protein